MLGPTRDILGCAQNGVEHGLKLTLNCSMQLEPDENGWWVLGLIHVIRKLNQNTIRGDANGG